MKTWRNRLSLALAILAPIACLKPLVDAAENAGVMLFRGALEARATRGDVALRTEGEA